MAEEGNTQSTAHELEQAIIKKLQISHVRVMYVFFIISFAHAFTPTIFNIALLGNIRVHDFILHLFAFMFFMSGIFVFAINKWQRYNHHILQIFLILCMLAFNTQLWFQTRSIFYVVLTASNLVLIFLYVSGYIPYWKAKISKSVTPEILTAYAKDLTLISTPRNDLYLRLFHGCLVVISGVLSAGLLIYPVLFFEPELLAEINFFHQHVVASIGAYLGSYTVIFAYVLVTKEWVVTKLTIWLCSGFFIISAILHYSDSQLYYILISIMTFMILFGWTVLFITQKDQNT